MVQRANRTDFDGPDVEDWRESGRETGGEERGEDDVGVRMERRTQVDAAGQRVLADS